MTKIVDKLKDNSVEKNLMLIGEPSKVIPTEVISIREKYRDFGINNSTKRAIDKVDSEILNKKKEFQQNKIKVDALNLLSKLFFPYKIVDYKTIDEIAKEYNLRTSALHYYDKPVADENVEELQTFKELFKRNIGAFNNEFSFPINHHFMFDTYMIKWHNPLNVDFTEYFNIMAPLSHFNFHGQNTVQIGNEIKRCNVDKPKFKYTAKLNFAEPSDPIILAPFIFMNKVYAFVVTAWDKKADDLRIRQSLM